MENTVTLGNDPSPEAVINVFPSLPIHSSVLVALSAGLFLAALIVRAQRMPSDGSVNPIMQRLSDRTAQGTRRPADLSLRRRARAERRASMTATTTRDRARVAENPQAAERTASGRASGTSATPGRDDAGRQGFRIRWGRTLVALVGLLALLTTAVTAPMAALTSLLATVPLITGAVLLLCLVTLRSMAVARRRRRRRERLEDAMREAMNPALPVDQQRRPSVPSTAGAAQTQQVQEPKAGRQTVQHQTGERHAEQERVRESVADRPAELDEDGLPQDIEATFGDSAPAEGVAQETRSVATEAWQPRAVPKPQYLEAEKAERAQPEPLVPEDPKPSTEVKIREDLPKAGSAATTAPVEAEELELAATGTEGPASAGDTRPAGVQESLDLDAVLKRRRA